MSSQRKKGKGAEILDAEYSITKDDGSRRKVRPLSAHPMYPVATTGGKLVAKGAIWVLKNTVLMMVEGIKGALSGMAESNREMNEEYRKFNAESRETWRTGKGNSKGGNDYYFVPRAYKRDRPFWYIPTKEEEFLDVLKDRGAI